MSLLSHRSQSPNPRVPIEILEKIISQCWSLNLTSKERSSFTRTSMLVNSTWMKIYMRVSAQDVHLSHPLSVSKFFDILSGTSPVYNKFGGNDLHDFLCRSITFRRDHDTGSIDVSVLMVAQFLSKTLEEQKPRLPNLHRLSFELVDQAGLSAIFPLNSNQRSIKPSPFPSSITTLEFFCSYSPGVARDQELMRDILLNVTEPIGLEKGLGSFSLPFTNVRRLCMYSVPVGSMRSIVQACPNLHEYDSDVGLKGLAKCLEIGTKLALEKEQARREEEIAQAALDDEIEMRMRMQEVVDLGTDEDVLEALGVGVGVAGEVDVKEVKSVLAELRRELSKTLRKEKNGQVDVLARRFLQKCIMVCEKMVFGKSGSSSITSDSSTASSEDESDSGSEDYCSVSSLRIDEAIDLVNDSFRTVSSSSFQPVSCLGVNDGKSKSFNSISKRPWTLVKRAAHKVFGKFVSARS